ncbi:hypothetical protein NGA_0194700, partial [Nannochloropsis gaditana CCMP526]|uniref:uncharacterized protein n=1 Tax=Nannochloropsis gaditana (strain CCMP526) TaxID=1093141 RepID=UPI00029F6015
MGGRPGLCPHRRGPRAVSERFWPLGRGRHAGGRSSPLRPQGPTPWESRTRATGCGWIFEGVAALRLDSRVGGRELPWI